MTMAFLFSLTTNAAFVAALVATYIILRRKAERQVHNADVIVALNDMLQTQIDELQQRFQDTEMLTEMSELLQISRSIGEAADVLPAFGTRLFPGVSGAVYVTRAMPGMVETTAWWGTFPSGVEFATTDCWALRRAHLHTGSAAGIRCPHDDKAIGATMCIPMLALGEAIGVVTLNVSDALSFEPSVEQFAKSFTDQIAFALANLRLQETLRTRAVRDPLTGLFNRRFLEEALASELARAARCQQRVGVVMLDIDHFKTFNDTYGHLGGDAVLQQFARQMQTVLRDDVVCRYGGEEFVIVLRDATLDGLRARAQTLVDSARHLRVQVEGEVLAPITVSAGIALSDERRSTPPSLLAAADNALYAAKGSGRDRVGEPIREIAAA
jgi:diguanylate cyclase (GGDEF)-like protein